MFDGCLAVLWLTMLALWTEWTRSWRCLWKSTPAAARLFQGGYRYCTRRQRNVVIWPYGMGCAFFFMDAMGHVCQVLTRLAACTGAQIGELRNWQR